MPTHRLFRSVLLAGVLVLATNTAHAGPTRGGPDITPFLTCIVPTVPGDPMSDFTAYFGYESRVTSVVQVLVGTDNRFIPNPAARGQPELFFPGYAEKAFRVDVPANTITQWVLLGQAVAVSPSAPRCADTTRAALHPALSVVDGTDQQATVGSGFARPIVVRATANDLPVPGMVLRVIAPTGGATATLQPADGVVVTGADGTASLVATANSVIGSYRLRVVAGAGPEARGSAFVALANRP
jgi:hypothetical protein